MSLLNTLDFILNHPLNVDSRLSALRRFLTWQVGSRLLPGKVAVDFVNDTRLLVSAGMTGATGNIYSGLHEFSEMAFALHVLRKGDLFVDVGANVGSYTVLAAGGVGANCISIEPIPATFSHLLDNIRLNDIAGITQALAIGVGSESAVLRFTNVFDTTNHVATERDMDVVEVSVRTLDEIVGDRKPALIKLDVEGFECAVLAGARKTLMSPTLFGLIVELNGSGRQYGFSDKDICKELTGFGFTPIQYSPLERLLRPIATPITKDGTSGNVLFVRHLEEVANRLKTAPTFRVIGKYV